MKKSILSIFVLLSILSLYTIKTQAQAGSEIEICITSKKPTSFDLYENGKVKPNIKTPYEFIIKSDSAKYIFKSRKNQRLRITLNGKKSSAETEQALTVLLIRRNIIEIFGY